MADEVAYNTAVWMTRPLKRNCFFLNRYGPGCRYLTSFTAKQRKTYPDAPEKLKFNEAVRGLSITWQET